MTKIDPIFKTNHWATSNLNESKNNKHYNIIIYGHDRLSLQLLFKFIFLDWNDNNRNRHDDQHSIDEIRDSINGNGCEEHQQEAAGIRHVTQNADLPTVEECRQNVVEGYYQKYSPSTEKQDLP